MTALRIARTTGQQVLDQRELGLVARQERIEGMDEMVRWVQGVRVVHRVSGLSLSLLRKWSLLGLGGRYFFVSFSQKEIVSRKDHKSHKPGLKSKK